MRADATHELGPCADRVEPAWVAAKVGVVYVCAMMCACALEGRGAMAVVAYVVVCVHLWCVV